jgi:hypothetical protein
LQSCQFGRSKINDKEVTGIVFKSNSKILHQKYSGHIVKIKKLKGHKVKRLPMAANL